MLSDRRVHTNVFSLARRNVVVGLGAMAFAAVAGWSRPPSGAPARGAAPPDTNSITPQEVNAGRQIFHGKGMCFACHGADLQGGPIAPTLKPHNWKDAKGGDLDAIFYIDTHGVAGTAMVSHPGGISDAEAGEVAAYIWSVGHRGAKP